MYQNWPAMIIFEMVHVRSSLAFHAGQSLACRCICNFCSQPPRPPSDGSLQLLLFAPTICPSIKIRSHANGCSRSCYQLIGFTLHQHEEMVYLRGWAIIGAVFDGNVCKIWTRKCFPSSITWLAFLLKCYWQLWSWGWPVNPRACVRFYLPPNEPKLFKPKVTHAPGWGNS